MRNTCILLDLKIHLKTLPCDKSRESHQWYFVNEITDKANKNSGRNSRRNGENSWWNIVVIFHNIRGTFSTPGRNAKVSTKFQRLIRILFFQCSFPPFSFFILTFCLLVFCFCFSFLLTPLYIDSSLNYLPIRMALLSSVISKNYIFLNFIIIIFIKMISLFLDFSRRMV